MDINDVSNVVHTCESNLKVGINVEITSSSVANSAQVDSL